MKKLIAAITVLLLICCPVTAFAAETNTAEVPGEQGIAVYGRTDYGKDYYEIVLGEQDADTLKLPDGITFSGKSDSEDDNGLHVIIIPVTAADEADAYAWMTDAAKDLGKDPTAYYLMFYRDDGFAEQKGHVTITSEKSNKNKLCYMDGNAASKELPCTLDNDTVSFEMEQSGYYIMVKSESAPTPIFPDSPKTGDTSDVSLYLLTMSASALLLILLWIIGRNRRKTATPTCNLK